MNRFKERHLPRMDIAGSGESKSALNRCTQIRENVAKQVVTDNDVVLARVEHHEHCHSVDVLVVRCNLRIAGCNLPEYTVPEIATKPLHIRFVSHCHAL